MAEELPAVGTPEESIPRAVVPWNRDDDRSRYLGLRASGFTIREALALIDTAKSTLSHWRKDPKFLDLEERLPEYKKELALEYVALETIRNFRLVLEKDRRVFQESLVKRTKTIEIDGKSVVVPVGMDSQDFQYLLKARAFYTPQQLQAIEQLFGHNGSSGSGGVNWTDLFVELSRTTVKEEIKIGTRQKSNPQIGKIQEDVIEGELVGET